MAHVAAAGATVAAGNAMLDTPVASAASSSLGERRSRMGKGNVAQSDGLRRQALSKSLAPLQLGKKNDAYVHVQYTFNPVGAANSLEPITLTVSTPVPQKPPGLSSDLTSGSSSSSSSSSTSTGDVSSEHSELGISKQEADKIVRDLGRFFKLPSPDSKDVSIHVDVKRHPYADLQVGERWQEIQGRKDWEGLIGSDAVDIDSALRGEIVRYGEFAQATYDAFDHREDSLRCGDCRFDKASLLDEVGLRNRGYEITDFIYATAEAHLRPHFFRRHTSVTAHDDEEEKAWSKDSNFMGFVAVCTSPEEIKRLGRRDIVVAWRGTVTHLEWVENVQDAFSPTGFDLRTVASPGTPVMVESGFLSVYKSKNSKSRYNKQSAREQVLGALKRIVQQYKDEDLSITVTGHSLGSALAMLCAYDIAESGINKRDHSRPVPQHWDAPHLDELEQDLKHPETLAPKLEAEAETEAETLSSFEVMSIDKSKVILAKSPKVEVAKSEESVGESENGAQADRNHIPISVFSFAGPRLGNSAFKSRVERLGVKVLRVVNVHDVVPKVPGIIFNEKLEFLHKIAQFLPSSYVHVGQLLELDFSDSKYLRQTHNLVDAHNMEAYLHMVDGYHDGPEERFSPAVKRDLALVNKASDFLEHRFGIPGSWWEEKKMVQDPKTGHWVVREDEVAV